MRIFQAALAKEQARLTTQATAFAGNAGLGPILARATNADLAGLGVPNTLSNRFEYVAVTGPRGAHVYSSRGADWSVLSDRRMINETAAGVAQAGTAVTRDGTPIVFATVPVAIDGPRSGVVVVGEPITDAQLEQIVQPLALTLELVTSGGRHVSSLVGASSPFASERVFAYPLRVSPLSVGRAWLRVHLSAGPLRQATASAATSAVVVASGLALVLLLFVGLLLDRAVVRPLQALRVGLADVEAGRFDAQVSLGRVREFEQVAAGFQRMAAIVGDQQGLLREQASRDPLTGLANHVTFYAALEQTAVRPQPLSVLVLDVDHFKAINDGHGHPYGDEVLRTVARRLEKAVREGDVAARLGGDEFAALLMGIDGEQAGEVAERIRLDLAEMPVGHRRLSVSVGVANFTEKDRLEPSAMVEAADRALYEAKHGGRGRVVRAPARRAQHGPEAATERQRVLDLLGQPDGIVVAFQPVVAIQDGKIVGFEALARFPNDLEKASPPVWFARAHRCGLGSALEVAAVRAALCAANRPAGFLALNVSPSVLLSEEMTTALPDSLDDIVIELTEHEEFFDEPALCARLEQLRARGARIALDDAGAGYAGLRQLLILRPDIIKLDRSLIDGVDVDPVRQAMVKALVGFAAQTGATVCAEGVETLEQAKELASLHVDLAQGYALARPAGPWPALALAATETLGHCQLEPDKAADRDIAQLAEDSIRPRAGMFS